MENSEDHENGAVYEPLLDKVQTDNVTPFAEAGFLSKISFCWLNPLMKLGKGKILQDDDIPRLRLEERVETCYSMFMEQLHKEKRKNQYDTYSILSTIFYCEWRGILVSGFFALTKVLTLSTGPLFLSAFIMVAEGEEAFKYEGYVLAGGLFVAKCLESLSERQWFFRARLIGLRIRSFLSAAICQKQLRLSSAAKMTHSLGEIVNYVTSDAYRIGEFPYWFHQIWSTSLQLCLALAIVYYAVGLATLPALAVLILIVASTFPMAKLQLKYQRRLMEAQDKRLKAIAEALVNMKVLKLYAWEKHFKKAIEGLRKEESEWIVAVLWQQGYYLVLFWSSAVLVPAVTFWACYFMSIPLTASNVFMFLASLRIVQEPIRLIPDVVRSFIQAKVSLSRITEFLEAPELENKPTKQESDNEVLETAVFLDTREISWDGGTLKETLRNINLSVRKGEKVAICGEVGSGKSTLLAAILREVPFVNGVTAWIQTGTIQENILFGSAMDSVKYQEVIRKCSLAKDIKMFPFGDQTQIGERGVNLSGGQKQRIQLARALYQDADVYLLDDPFSAVDAHTATNLFNEYVMKAVSGKTVLLVTHQVDFLPAFNSILLMSSGQIISTGSYDQLMASCQKFQDLVNVHNTTSGSGNQIGITSLGRPGYLKEEIQNIYIEEQLEASLGSQLIKQEEREIGDSSFKPYLQYLKHNKGFLFFTLATVCHIFFIAGQLVQNCWLASEVNTTSCSASESIFCVLLHSLIRAPMSFYDSTPLGRILSRVSSDLSIIDIDVAFKLTIALVSTMNTYLSFLILGFLTWPVLFVIIPMIYLTLIIQYASSNELMWLDGTTKSTLASHLAESIARVMIIRAFGQEDRFFSRSLCLIDANASPYFHSFSANEWLVQRLEVLCAIVLMSSALAITFLDFGSSSSGYVGTALAYGLSLNAFLVFSAQFQCSLSNLIVSVERLEQYMHIQSEAPDVIEDRRRAPDWPSFGNVEICDLKVQYRPDSPLVLHGITCKIKGGHKIGIVGRTGSGKTTLISALFRLVEPIDGKIIVDGLDITTIGLHSLRSQFGVIPQDPILFGGTVRYNLDPLSEHTDEEIWEVLGKCQLREAIQEKEKGLESLVVHDGSNWSMGQRQLLCLGRVLLRRSRILVLDEATASIDNTTDSIIQRTIRREFVDSTVLTVAHRIPTVMDCSMVLVISDGRLVEFDEPMKLVGKDDSLFAQLYKEYWSRTSRASGSPGLIP
ncbi:hypothetical protein NL676_010089 [Syzygium grande]|nr:hypothetical protein NL676_010089 [Syzygium grande]